MYRKVTKPITLQEHYERFRNSFANDSLESLVQEFNRQVGNKGWTGVRSAHDMALRDEILSRGGRRRYLYRKWDFF